MDIRRADDRFVTSSEWLESRHSFSFGPFYDPANIGFGFLVAHNDDVVAPGTGFETHPHQDLEIVTWVLRGALAHRDSEGHSGVVHPGLVQRMSAGSGIRHSEWNDGPDPVHYLQMWVRPDHFDLTPSYAQSPVDLSTGELTPVVSGLPHHATSTAIRLHQHSAGLSVARLAPTQSVVLPDAPHVHVFIAEGSAHLEGVGNLGTADAARLTTPAPTTSSTNPSLRADPGPADTSSARELHIPQPQPTGTSPAGTHTGGTPHPLNPVSHLPNDMGAEPRVIAPEEAVAAEGGVLLRGGGRRLTAGPAGAEVLVWEMY